MLYFKDLLVSGTFRVILTYFTVVLREFKYGIEFLEKIMGQKFNYRLEELDLCIGLLYS
jgi:hypothetical protein